MTKQPKQIGVKMDPNMVEQIDRLADMHHRDRSGEVIHACALYIAAHITLKHSSLPIPLVGGGWWMRVRRNGRTRI